MMTKNGIKDKYIKLLLLSPTLSGGKGGTERVASELANAMAKRNHIVHIAHKNRGIPAYHIDAIVKIFSYKNISQLKEYVALINPDVFFVFYFGRHLIHYYSIIHSTGIPFGMQECTNPHRLIVNNWGLGSKENLPIATRCWERELIGSAAHRIRLTMPCYTQSFASYIQPNVRAFPNPAFPQQRLAKPGDNHSKKKVIINVGGMKANKNLITLLKAFAPIAQKYPDWIIKVFGKSADGQEPHKVEIREFIKAHHLEDRVLISGPTDDIFSEFAASHIHVISSLSEGCPTCVLEAMATGVPSIGYADCPGTNELIRHEINGLLAAPEDRVAGMETALKHLMSSSELRARLGRQALEDSKEFEPKTIYDQWEQLFFEASEYKNDPERLLREQMDINPERALHARRMRDKLLQQYKG